MIFSSLEYLLFLPIVAILYWHTRGAVRTALVVVASYIFYMSWLPIYGIMLAVMTTLNWLLGLALGMAQERKRSMLKPLLAVGLIGNLGCLCYYKYANFFLSNMFAAAGWLAAKVSVDAVPLSGSGWVGLNILLPLGVSFFVFEFVHYLVDIYRGDKPVKSWLEFAAFAAFFPSQIAGPIKRYQEFVEWLRKPLPWSSRLIHESGALIMQGLFKKVAIADPIGIIIAPAFAGGIQNLSCTDAWLASIGFFIQVYCDFSGYTDIGRGSALLLGIKLPENFNLPYMSQDLADFWRRWHMSLSYWLRDYVYIPLGGSRSEGRIANWRNVFITMVACGLWHGAAWHYVVFGCLQGVGLIIHREWKTFARKIGWLSAAGKQWIVKQYCMFLTALFIVATYTIFRAPDVPAGLNILRCWFSTNMDCTLVDPIAKSGVVCLLAVYMAYWLSSEWLKKDKAFQSIEMPGLYATPLRFASWTAALFLILAARPTVATPFVYFQF